MRDLSPYLKSRIGNHCMVGDGAHAKLTRQCEGVPYLTSKNFKPEGLDLAKVDYISEQDFDRHFRPFSKAITMPQSGDVLVGIIGSLGEPYVVSSSDRFGLSSSVAIIRPDQSLLSPKYLYYWMKDSTFQRAVHGIKGGVAQSYLSLEMIRSLPLYFPSLSIQKRVAALLSAYDDLIDNNTRRIQILEEIAQRLYREWFVDFRFPGHENVKMVESEVRAIPEGWVIRDMKDVCQVIDCLHSKKPNSVDGGAGILLQLFNIGAGGKLDLEQQYKISQEDYQKWTNRIEVRGGDCVVTNVGRIGAVAQIPQGVRAAIGRNMTAIRPKPEQIGPAYLIEYLLSPYMEDEVLKKKDAGTIMDSLNVKGIVRLSVPIADRKLMTSFESEVAPMRKLIEVLVAQSSNLRTTRNLLLPKLISGEIPVEAAEEMSTEPELIEALA